MYRMICKEWRQHSFTINLLPAIDWMNDCRALLLFIQSLRSFQPIECIEWRMEFIAIQLRWVITFVIFLPFVICFYFILFTPFFPEINSLNWWRGKERIESEMDELHSSIQLHSTIHFKWVELTPERMQIELWMKPCGKPQASEKKLKKKEMKNEFISESMMERSARRAGHCALFVSLHSTTIACSRLSSFKLMHEIQFGVSELISSLIYEWSCVLLPFHSSSFIHQFFSIIDSWISLLNHESKSYYNCKS